MSQRSLWFLGLSLLFFGLVAVDAYAAPESASAEPEIVMYVMPQCGYCERARRYLQARGLQWREIDIAASAEAKADFDAHGGAGTPLILVNGQRVSGFDQPGLDRILAEQRG